MTAVLETGEEPTYDTFAVLDVETTGLFPSAHHRIVEIAIVRSTRSGQIVREYSTLINPDRDLGPVDIHGVATADVLSAPRFSDVAGDVIDELSESIIVGHNVRFDIGFLDSEFSRLGVQFPPVPAVCTLDLASRTRMIGGSRRLGSCCQALGITHLFAHSALGDARATSALFACLAQNDPSSLLQEPSGRRIQEGAFPNLARRRVTHTRFVAEEDRRFKESYLSGLVSRLQVSVSATAGSEMDSATNSYLELLDRALDDRHISQDEAKALVELASKWGMSSEAVVSAHRSYLDSLAKVALADGIVSESERSDLLAVTKWLGLASQDLEDALSSASGSHQDIGPSSLAGCRVCFTGQLTATIDGEPITREMAEDLATAAGLTVSRDVTKKVDILVTSDPLSQSGKAKKARTYGIRIIAEPVFWQDISVGVD